ncbi:alpha/beta fold hydrolase [Amycolatopsis sp. NPDC051061]|uniref:alpha/beta fold hydrolase n=1 Tax=Amycolatopsis sp. NPDC051061 TaxID=3155042 RepID=UPI003437D991
MTNLHTTDDGPRDAPVLLLVHGSASSVRSWDALLPLLTGTHRVVRIDLLGHGRSAKPDDAGYGVPEQSRRAGEALDRLSVEHAVVVGHSSGGLVATALAEQRPTLVTALVLVDTGSCRCRVSATPPCWKTRRGPPMHCWPSPGRPPEPRQSRVCRAGRHERVVHDAGRQERVVHDVAHPRPTSRMTHSGPPASPMTHSRHPTPRANVTLPEPWGRPRSAGRAPHVTCRRNR